MVHKICDNNANCQTIPEVASFIATLNANIGRDCSSTTKSQQELILVTLKAFGNAGDAVTSNSVIGRCITNRDVDSETRVAALQAFRRVPCSVSVSVLFIFFPLYISLKIMAITENVLRFIHVIWSA